MKRKIKLSERSLALLRDTLRKHKEVAFQEWLRSKNTEDEMKWNEEFKILERDLIATVSPK